MKRKNFLNSLLAGTAIFSTPLSALAGSTISSAGNSTGSMYGFKAAPIDKVRIGIIGIGNRGGMLIAMLQWLVENNKAQIVALSDLEEHKVLKGTEQMSSWQNDKPTQYFGGPEEWKKLAERDDIDLLIIATPWALHTPMALYGMEQGKHVAVEVPIAYTLEDCWSLVETAEKTKRHCIMLENCCYNDEELWILNMVQQGVFGDLTHAEGAYLHDLRMYMLHETYYQDQWRLKHHVDHDGNLYSTHGIGPIAMYMGIGRGDAFSHLVSMSSREKNLSDAAQRSNSQITAFKAGDMNNTLLRTAKGKTILLQFDTHTGGPYSRINKLSGTKATHDGYPSRLFIEPEELSWVHDWLGPDQYKEYQERFQHPILKRLGELKKGFEQGHGGMDFIMIYRLINCLNAGAALDMNVYDGVMWSAITPLSESSVANGSAPRSFPDFTGGLWKENQDLEIMRPDVTIKP